MNSFYISHKKLLIIEHIQLLIYIIKKIIKNPTIAPKKFWSKNKKKYKIYHIEGRYQLLNFDFIWYLKSIDIEHRLNFKGKYIIRILTTNKKSKGMILNNVLKKINFLMPYCIKVEIVVAQKASIIRSFLELLIKSPIIKSYYNTLPFINKKNLKNFKFEIEKNLKFQSILNLPYLNKNKLIVIFVIRCSNYLIERNSSDAWVHTANYLVSLKKYQVIIIPDSYNPKIIPGIELLNKESFKTKDIVIDEEAAFSLVRRYFLYSLAELTISGNNGPASLLQLSNNKYLIYFKPCTDDKYTSHEYVAKRFGIKKGESLKFRFANQKIIWSDDEKYLLLNETKKLLKN